MCTYMCTHSVVPLTVWVARDTRALTYNDYLLQLAQDQHQKYTDYQTLVDTS